MTETMRSKACEHCGEVVTMEVEQGKGRMEDGVLVGGSAKCACGAMHLYCFDGKKVELFLPRVPT
jgi:hypothetical protein